MSTAFVQERLVHLVFTARALRVRWCFLKPVTRGIRTVLKRVIEYSAATARTITAAERDGCKSHGLFRLPGYCNALRTGKADREARPEIVDASISAVRVDAARGLAPYALECGLTVLEQKAKSTGVAALAVKNVFHFR